MTMNPIPMRSRFLRGLAAGALLALLAGPAAAQLPSPPVSSAERLHIGGYGGAVFGHDTAPGVGTETGISEANAALLFSGTLVRRLSYFGELEAASTTRQNWTGNDEDDALVLERLYIEYAFGDALRLRAGRFLTPVGQWNEIHAEPLTWTARRPLTTYRPFAKSMTGIMAAGQIVVAGHDAGYAAYASVPRGLVRDDEESHFLHAFGTRGALEIIPGLYLGASAVAFRASRPVGPDDDGESEVDEAEAGESAEHEAWEEDSGDRFLGGLDLSWRFAGAELLAEATALSGTDATPAERGAFLQLAVPLLRSGRVRLHAVGRSEYYDPVVDRPLAVHTLGLALRPTRHLTVKVERQLTDRPSYRVRDGWYVSLSGIF